MPRYAQQVAEIGRALESKMPDGYRRTDKSFLGDWPIENTENAVFRESHTDFAVIHPQSITVFHDGLTAEGRPSSSSSATRTGPPRWRASTPSDSTTCRPN
ncbi:hypothetical protein [Halobellus sp. EA9]|uniref:hypothetical protein n=1 Tax=Halobellus sp. EA9 TaxID=3421647 RepID=UPI003EBBCD98